jgi:hypothetical protein
MGKKGKLKSPQAPTTPTSQNAYSVAATPYLSPLTPPTSINATHMAIPTSLHSLTAVYSPGMEINAEKLEAFLNSVDQEVAMDRKNAVLTASIQDYSIFFRGVPIATLKSSLKADDAIGWITRLRERLEEINRSRITHFSSSEIELAVKHKTIVQFWSHFDRKYMTKVADGAYVIRSYIDHVTAVAPAVKARYEVEVATKKDEKTNVLSFAMYDDIKYHFGEPFMERYLEDDYHKTNPCKKCPKAILEFLELKDNLGLGNFEFHKLMMAAENKKSHQQKTLDNQNTNTKTGKQGENNAERQAPTEEKLLKKQNIIHLYMNRRLQPGSCIACGEKHNLKDCNKAPPRHREEGELFQKLCQDKAKFEKMKQISLEYENSRKEKNNATQAKKNNNANAVTSTTFTNEDVEESNDPNAHGGFTNALTTSNVEIVLPASNDNVVDSSTLAFLNSENVVRHPKFQFGLMKSGNGLDICKFSFDEGTQLADKSIDGIISKPHVDELKLDEKIYPASCIFKNYWVDIDHETKTFVETQIILKFKEKIDPVTFNVKLLVAHRVPEKNKDNTVYLGEWFKERNNIVTSLVEDFAHINTNYFQPLADNVSFANNVSTEPQQPEPEIEFRNSTIEDAKQFAQFNEEIPLTEGPDINFTKTYDPTEDTANDYSGSEEDKYYIDYERLEGLTPPEFIGPLSRKAQQMYDQVIISVDWSRVPEFDHEDLKIGLRKYFRIYPDRYRYAYPVSCKIPSTRKPGASIGKLDPAVSNQKVREKIRTFLQDPFMFQVVEGELKPTALLSRAIHIFSKKERCVGNYTKANQCAQSLWYIIDTVEKIVHDLMDDMHKEDEDDSDIKDIPNYEKDWKIPYISAMDLRDCFFQFENYDPNDLWLIALDLVVYRPLRIQLGCLDSPMKINRRLTEIFAKLVRLRRYFDDFIWSNRSYFRHKRMLFAILDISWATGLFWKPQSFRLFRSRLEGIVGCTVGLFANGIIAYYKNPRKIMDLFAFESPKTYGEVSFIVHFSRVCSSNIPNFAALIYPIAALLKGKDPKKKVLDKIPLEPELWTPHLQQCFQKLKDTINKQIVNELFDPNQITAIHSDSSSEFYGCVVTQFKPEDLGKPYDQIQFRIIGFDSGKFDDRLKHEHIRFKELYAVFEGVKAFEHLIRGSRGPLISYVDHAPLLKLNKMETASVQTHMKIVRIALYLSELNIVFIHLPGNFNLIADRISRTPNLAVTDSHQVTTLEGPIILSEKEIVSYVNNSTTSEFKITNLEEVEDKLGKNIFQKVKDHTNVNVKPEKAEFLENGLWYRRDMNSGYAQIIVPEVTEVTTHLLWHAHYRKVGHASALHTQSYLERYFYWSTLRKDVEKLVKDCLLCAMVKSRNFRFPLGRIPRAMEIFAEIVFDFAEMVESIEGMKYILIILDLFSQHVEIYATVDETAATTAECLLKYGSTYLDPEVLHSDRGPHFKNEVMQRLSKSKHQFQRFSMPEVPFSNGIIENMVGQVKNKIILFLAEFRVVRSRWVRYIPAIKTCLNNTPIPSLGNRSPNEIVFRYPNRSPVPYVWHEEKKNFEVLSYTAEVQAVIKQMRENFTAIHQTFEEIRFPKKAKVENLFNLPLEVGQPVLIAVESPSNLQLRWTKLGIITQVISNWIYSVKDIVNGTTTEYHVARLKPYASKDYESNLDDFELMFYQSLVDLNIVSIDEFRIHNGRLQCKVTTGTPSQAPKWMNVSEIIFKIPKYFQRLLNSELCADPEVHTKLEKALKDPRTKLSI